MPRSFKARYIPCPVKSCTRQFTNQGGLKNHIRMHRMPQANQDLPAHQPPENDENILADNEEDAQELGPEHQNNPPNPEKVAKEKITYHPLINGTPTIFIRRNVTDSYLGLPCDAQGNFLPEGGTASALGGAC